MLASGSNFVGVFETRRCRAAAGGGEALGCLLLLLRTGEGDGERLAFFALTVLLALGAEAAEVVTAHAEAG